MLSPVKDVIVAKQTLRNNDEQMLVTEVKGFDCIEEDLKSEVKFRDVAEVANWIKTGEF